MSAIYVCGGTLEQARQYCKQEGLEYPRGFLVFNAQSVRTLSRDVTLRLVGSFWQRRDAFEIEDIAKVRGLKIEDLTG